MAGSKTDPIVNQIKNIEIDSAAPSATSLARSGSNFTLKWKRGETYGNKTYKKQGVRFRRKIKPTGDGKVAEWKAWSSVTVTASATFATKEYALSDYYPYSGKTDMLKAIQAEVRGLENDFEQKVNTRKSGNDWVCTLIKADKKWSDYDKKIIELEPPNIPEITGVTPGSTATAFAYKPSKTNASTQPFHSIEYTSRLVHNWGTKDPTDIKWSDSTRTGYKTGTSTNASGTVSIAEDTGLIGETESYTRVIRMRSRGCAGNSKWTYKMYVYAYPNKLKDEDFEEPAVQKIAGGYRVTVAFKPRASDTHPVDQFRFEYCVAVPKNGKLAIPTGSAAPSWTPVTTIGRDVGKDRVAHTFNIEPRLSADTCLWVRVVQIHGSFETPSVAKLVKSAGITIAPIGATDLSISAYNSSTHSITLSCTNPSEIPTSFLKIVASYYANGKWNQKAEFTIPHGNSSVTDELDLNSWRSWAFDTYVGIGEDLWSGKVRTKYNPRAEATNPAEFIPRNVKVEAGTAAGSIDVQWDNVMEEITAHRVAVATSPTEWSLDNPDFVYDETVENSGNTATIGSLEHDVPYYVKVKTTNEHGTSNWSAGTPNVTLKSSAIPVPKLTLSETADHSIKVTWNWDTWASATAVNLSWSDNPQSGDTDYKDNEVTINRNGKKGSYSYTITQGIERGKRWYVQAEFVSGNAVSDPGSKSIMLDVTPVTPTGIAAIRYPLPTDEAGKTTVSVSWNNSWKDADSTEVSWSDNSSAWDTTDGPKTYSLTGLRGRDTSVLIPGLDLGKTWYFKVKLIYDDKFETDVKVMNPAELDLTTIPVVKNVHLSDTLISDTAKTDMSWEYYCEDLAEQKSADILITNSNGTTVAAFGIGGTDTSVPIYASDRGLTGDNTYYIKVRATSANGPVSEWSDPVPLMVQHKPIAEITATSLVNGELTELPLTVTVSGAGTDGLVTCCIERAQSVFQPRPDESTKEGYEGELVALEKMTGSGTISIDQDNLRGYLDDGALYRIVVIIADNLAQSDPVYQEFSVAWEDQAVLPEATREVDEEAYIVKITPTEPEDAPEGGTCDIYRLSADKPELIVENAEWDVTYVDPYPAFGETGGHRIVFKTANGDVTTEDGALAWIDLDGSADADVEGAETDVTLISNETVIDFDGKQIKLPFNLEISNSWAKDFTETKYLGGSVQGDWNPAVSRTGSINAVAVTSRDQETIRLMRRLAVWDGICHVRTPDGSSFNADIQVSEDRGYSTAGKIASFSLSVTRVDAQAYEGMTLAEWEAGEEEEETEEGES